MNNMEITNETMKTANANILMVGILIGFALTTTSYYVAHTIVLVFKGLMSRHRNKTVIKEFKISPTK